MAAGPLPHATPFAPAPPLLLGPLRPRTHLQLGEVQTIRCSNQLPSAGQMRHHQLVGRPGRPTVHLLFFGKGPVPGSTGTQMGPVAVSRALRADAYRASQPPPIGTRQAGLALLSSLLPPGGRTSVFADSSPSPRGRSAAVGAPPPRPPPPPQSHRACVKHRTPGPHNSLPWPTRFLSGSARSAQVAAPHAGARGVASVPADILAAVSAQSSASVRSSPRSTPGSQSVREPAGVVWDAQQNGAVKASSDG
ncbi:hypothetical protein NDU88_003138 [Pleurodeles waltl]|uniref:Uncharacterized protein n=1 Tax=Pleurodeles waltl TaxID=8319 RepID=A0AAV7RC17_PLEWA|nr:hypothetical protein NDU88_003138 [Pleurodeles waltl]